MMLLSSVFSSPCICSLGLVVLISVRCLIFCSRLFSSCCCCFFLYDEYDIFVPVITALPVSHKSDGEVSGESFISRKNAHSFLIKLSKSESRSKEILKCHLLGGLIQDWACNVIDMGA